MEPKKQKYTRNKKKIVGGFVPLGYSEADSIIWSVARQCVVHMTPANIGNTSNLIALLGSKWCLNNYPKLNAKGEICGTDFQSVTAAISEKCIAKGLYSHAHVRGAGVWRHGDSIVINSKVVTAADGKEIARAGDSDYVYPAVADIGEPMTAQIATNEDIEALVAVIESFNWKYQSDSRLIIGWLYCAYVCGALKWRPHVYLTGKRGSGKSTFENLLANLMNGYAVHAPADSSPAGIRQRIKQGALPVLLDEAEGDGDTILKIIELFRAASSDCGDGVLKGTANQIGTSYKLAMCGLAAGIKPPAFTAADSTRIIQMQIEPVAFNAEPHELLEDDEQAQQLGLRLWKHAIKNHGSFVTLLKKVRKELSKAGDSQRAQDTLGAVIAGAMVMLNEHDVESFVAGLQLNHHRNEQDASDESDALEYLLSYMLKMQVANKRTIDERKEYMEKPIIEWLREACRDNDIAKAIARFGIRATNNHGNIALSIVKASSFAPLNDIFKGSKWEAGWRQLLLRLPSAEIKNVRVAGDAKKCIYVPTAYAAKTVADGDVVEIQKIPLKELESSNSVPF